MGVMRCLGGGLLSPSASGLH